MKLSDLPQIIFGIMGMFLCILGLVLNNTLFNFMTIFGMLSLLFALYIIHCQEIQELRKRIDKK